MVAAIAFTIRVSSLFPMTWGFFQTEPALHPTPTNRMSFKHQPLDVPLMPERREE